MSDVGDLTPAPWIGALPLDNIINANSYFNNTKYLHRGNRGRTKEEVAVGRGRGNIVWRPETRKVEQSMVSMEVSRRNRGNI